MLYGAYSTLRQTRRPKLPVVSKCGLGYNLRASLNRSDSNEMAQWQKDGLGQIRNGKMQIDTYHVYPVNDLKLHDLNQHCHCCPAIKENGMLIVHNSYDGREFFEPDSEGH